MNHNIRIKIDDEKKLYVVGNDRVVEFQVAFEEPEEIYLGGLPLDDIDGEVNFNGAPYFYKYVDDKHWVSAMGFDAVKVLEVCNHFLTQFRKPIELKDVIEYSVKPTKL